ncbi:hypothetical protein HG530_011021 [Fusarium avenaceum]|nr:hypothetical protein HG530_011021 [Fusarium avenaceum]
MYARPPSSLTSTLRPPEVFPAPSSSHLIVKREEPNVEPAEPILINSRSPSPEPRSTADSRQRLFASLENGEYVLHDARSIETANDLDDMELKRCFDILHACGLATDASTTLASTSDTMEDFLNAVFNGWAGNDGEELIKPTMDFVVREHITVGNICNQPPNHHTSASCTDSPGCQSPVYGIATYRSRPAQLAISFSTEEPPRNSSHTAQDLFCPMERADIRWEEDDWMTELRRGLKRSCTIRVHRYNKHLAIWHARSLIHGWARGSIWMGRDVEVLAFVAKDAVDAAFAMMGDA